MAAPPARWAKPICQQTRTQGGIELRLAKDWKDPVQERASGRRAAGPADNRCSDRRQLGSETQSHTRQGHNRVLQRATRGLRPIEILAAVSSGPMEPHGGHLIAAPPPFSVLRSFLPQPAK
jgi:hypothetical protein